jgi:hypothetical protein
MSSKITEATLKLTIERPPLFDEMVVTAKTQVAAAQKNASLPSKPAIDAGAKLVLSDAVDLETKVSAWRNAVKVAKALEGDVGKSALALLRDHGAFEAMLNQDCAGDEQAILDWGAEKATRTSPAPSTASPTNTRATVTKDEGTVVARCNAEAGAVCYLFQMGTDPANPQSWAPPVIEPGASHEVSGLTVGQKVYFRVAIYRRGTGQGQWSDIVGVTVK